MTGRLAEMIDWEGINKAEDMDELKEVKVWLFQENIRLENAKREFASAQERFFNEQVKLHKEMDELKHRAAQERKRLKEESQFIEKKLAILQDGFRQLDEDRRDFERQKRALEDKTHREYYEYDIPLLEESVNLMFRGANNPLALRKRYKDLVKIFHPDNLFGDKELAQSINREYLRRKGSED